MCPPLGKYKSIWKSENVELLDHSPYRADLSSNDVLKFPKSSKVQRF